MPGLAPMASPIAALSGSWRVPSRHVILVGLPGAGKSTVGGLLADALARPFVDFDVELERRAGRSVAEQFARDGEPAFRAREAELSRELAAALADSGPMVLAPGGGWLANAAAAAPLAPVGRTIYLRTSPTEALARLGDAVGTRPLLVADGDPRAALDGLLARRAAAYERADHQVETDGRSAADVAAELVRLVRRWEGA